MWYRLLRVGENGVDKFDSEWRQGVWLGHTRSSNEHVIGTPDGVIRAYTVKRLDSQERWDSALLSKVRGTPQQPDPGKPGQRVPIRVNFDPPAAGAAPPQPPPPDAGPNIRRMNITTKLLDRYGFTEGS